MYTYNNINIDVKLVGTLEYSFIKIMYFNIYRRYILR